MKVGEIMKGMRKKNQELGMMNESASDLAEKSAQAERNYNVAFATKIIDLRSHGEPATLVPTMAKGDKVVADLRIKMLIAEGVLNANREAIKNHRGALETYRSLLSWEKSEMEISRHVPEK